jgi:hypothetical protein
VPIISGSGSGGHLIGGSALVYRFTVTGADKATIDTGVDVAQAGSNDWTACDLLEILFYSRTDEAAAASQIQLSFNNDGGAVYDVQWTRVVGTTASFVSAVAGTAIAVQTAGASVANTSIFGVTALQIPNPTGAVANKTAMGTFGFNNPGDSTNQVTAAVSGAYRPAAPAALTRLKWTPNTGGQKFKVGTQLLIFKRFSS